VLGFVRSSDVLPVIRVVIAELFCRLIEDRTLLHHSAALRLNESMRLQFETVHTVLERAMGSQISIQSRKGDKFPMIIPQGVSVVSDEIGMVEL
jgi:hypothetical protein